MMAFADLHQKESEMTRMFRIVPIAFLFLIATSSVDRLEAQILLPEIAPTTITEYVAALSDYADAEPCLLYTSPSPRD